VRLGAKVRGWVLMDTVKVWFELWRLLNDFPLQFTRPGSDTPGYAGGDAAKTDKAADAK
jgi:hypothetical protein